MSVIFKLILNILSLQKKKEVGISLFKFSKGGDLKMSLGNLVIDFSFIIL